MLNVLKHWKSIIISLYLGSEKQNGTFPITGKSFYRWGKLIYIFLSIHILFVECSQFPRSWIYTWYLKLSHVASCKTVAILHDLTKVYYLRALPSLKEHHHGKKNIYIRTYLYKVATE